MTVDLERLTEKAAALRRSLADLGRLLAIPEAEFAADRDKTAGFRYHVVVAAEAAVEVCALMRSLAGVRNLLVHQHWTIDDLRLRREVSAAMPGLESFLAQIGRFVGRELPGAGGAAEP
ncbi:MAG: hypothetical protein HY905_14195 [Deltaproteobacteria bacterium]|nr:hypothetical protein [Deltaproteobacteria bacterium]